MILEEVLREPVISEKSTHFSERRVYVFVVDQRATKPEIKRAVESSYSVKVDKVRTLVRMGKKRLLPRFKHWVRRSNTKLAYVTLKSGDKIEGLQSG